MNSKGSVTVEASIVVAITAFVTFMFIFMGAYMEDICRVTSFCREFLWEGFGQRELFHSEEGRISWDTWARKGLADGIVNDYSELEKRLEKELSENHPALWFGNECSFHVSISKTKISISFQSDYRFPVKLGFLTDNGADLFGEYELSLTDTREWVRLIRGILKGFGGE